MAVSKPHNSFFGVIVPFKGKTEAERRNNMGIRKRKARVGR